MITLSNNFEFKCHQFSYLIEDSDAMSVAELEVTGLTAEAKEALNDDDFHEAVYQYVLNVVLH
jgi:hypothetical protein